MKKPKPLRTIAWSSILFLPLIIFSCFPGGPSATEDLDVAGTIHDPDFFGTGPLTYTMPDTVVHLISEGQDPESVDHSYDSLMLSTVMFNMDEYGYEWMEFDTTKAPADIVILITVVRATNSSIYFAPGWWWGFWGWWPGWGYPGAPVWGPGWGMGTPSGFPVGYSYSTGSVFIAMLDPDQFDPEDLTVTTVWLGAINGLLTANAEQGAVRISDGINQVFRQTEDVLRIN
jgi:hypothetical protein